MAIEIEEIWLKYLSDNQPLIVATHIDADGIYSGAIFSTVYKVKEVRTPHEFSEYGKQQVIEGKVYPKENVSLDLGPPLYKEFDGVAFDHHEHPAPAKYKLVHMRVPTGLILYRCFKDKIPDEHKWKVVGSLAGDGALEKVPNEIWDLFPELLSEKRAKIYPKYGQPKVYTFIPIYKLLSAPVNSMCRMGYAQEAYRLVAHAKHPSQILDHPTMKEMTAEAKKEEDRIWNEYGKKTGVVAVNDNISAFVMSSKGKMAGRIASRLRAMDDTRTWVVINDYSGAISVRGELAKYVEYKMKDSGFQLGGHPGYCGGRFLDSNQNGQLFIELLRRRLK